MRRVPTFTEIVGSVADDNSRRVAERAQAFNSIAHSHCKPQARRRAYAAKARAVLHGIAKFPGHYRLSIVEAGVVGLRYRSRGGFHLPARLLGGLKQDGWLTAERCRRAARRLARGASCREF